MILTDTVIEIQEVLQQKLGEERYLHSQGVMYTAAALAMVHDQTTQKDLVEKSLLAGILHDCGKFGSLKEQEQLCIELQVNLTPAEIQHPNLIHAKLGAHLAKTKYRVTDLDVLAAIRNHTVGRENMSLLEKIIYMADLIEPWRPHYPRIEEIRLLAFTDIDQAIALSTAEVIRHLQRSGREVDPSILVTLKHYGGEV